MRFPLNIQRALTSKEIVMMMMIVHDFHSIMWWWGLMSCLLRLGHQFWHGRDSLSKTGANSKDFCSNQFQHLCGDSRVDPLSLSTISQGSLDYCYILRGRCQKSLSPTFVKFQTPIWFSLELLLSSYFWRILRPVFSHFIPYCISCVLYVVFFRVLCFHAVFWLHF